MDTSQGKGEFKSMEKRVLGGRPHKDRVLNCPRCNSSNTKFCYYNNYSLSQPRYFCKSCRRYWTEGGTLRNVPVGGGSRKNKRPPSSDSSTSCTSSAASNYYPCLSKTVSVSVNVSPIGAPCSLSSRNPSFGFQDLALAGNFLLPGPAFQAQSSEKFFEPGRNRAFPNTVSEAGVSPIGLALGSSLMSITPHFTTSMASAADHPVGQLLFPFDFPLEGGIGSMHRAAGIDMKELVEVQGGSGGGDKLQVQGDQSHPGLWGGFFGAGPCLGFPGMNSTVNRMNSTVNGV